MPTKSRKRPSTGCRGTMPTRSPSTRPQRRLFRTPNSPHYRETRLLARFCTPAGRTHSSEEIGGLSAGLGFVALNDNLTLNGGGDLNWTKSGTSTIAGSVHGTSGIALFIDITSSLTLISLGPQRSPAASCWPTTRSVRAGRPRAPAQFKLTMAANWADSEP